jgi:hypothetical protein
MKNSRFYGSSLQLAMELAGAFRPTVWQFEFFTAKDAKEAKETAVLDLRPLRPLRSSFFG